MAKVEANDVALRLDDAIAKAGTLGESTERLNDATKRYDDTLEGTQRIERINAQLRDDLATATGSLSGELTRAQSLIAADTSEWRSNNAALQENLRLRRELSQFGAVTAPATAPVTAVPERAPPPTPTVAPVRPVPAPVAAPTVAPAPAPVRETERPVTRAGQVIYGAESDPQLQQRLTEAQSRLTGNEARVQALSNQLRAAEAALAAAPIGPVRTAEQEAEATRQYASLTEPQRRQLERYRTLSEGGSPERSNISNTQVINRLTSMGLLEWPTAMPELTGRAAAGFQHQLRLSEQGRAALGMPPLAEGAIGPTPPTGPQVRNIRATLEANERAAEASRRDVESIEREIEARGQLTAATQRETGAVEQAAATARRTVERAAPTVAPATAPEPREVPPTVAPTYGPLTARENEARALAEAERARNAVTQARREGGTPGEVGALRQQSQLANEAARRATSERKAAEQAEATAAADRRLAEAEAARTEADYRAAQEAQSYAQAGRGAPPPGGYSLATVSERAAAEREATAAEAAAAPQAPWQRITVQSEAARLDALRGLPFAPAGVGGAPPGGGFRPPPPPPPPPAPPGGPPPEEPGGGRAAMTAEEAAYAEKVARTDAILEKAAGSQHAFNLAEQEAAARYAASSNALSRHGALTTEFIQALARGDVTLREFGSQMVSTIGKFGGWIVAGAAIYGVIKLFDDLKRGALDTNEAIANLGRFIPGLGGPEGGGTGQVPRAQEMLRSISGEFNVPIKEVGDTMQLTARVFHDLGGAGEATRAALAASRLDQIPVEMSTQYLVGIAQSTGMPTAGPGAGSGLIGIVNSLNQLQNYGARVTQTLPAVARAAPAAVAAGMPLNELEAIVGLGVRAGIPGGQVGTAMARSLANFVFRPAAQQLFASLHIATPTLTDAGSIYSGAFGFIDRERRAGREVSPVTMRALANALASPQIGARTLLPILEAEQKGPGAYQRFLAGATDPRPYTEDLKQVLSSVTEQFKRIGTSLEQFGSQLASIGALTPIQDLFWVLRTMGHAFQTVLSPIESLVAAFNRLSTPLENVIAATLALVFAQQAYRRTFLGSAAQQFLGRVPGFEDVRDTPRQFIRQRQAELRTYLLPQAETEQRAAQQEAAIARGRVSDLSRQIAALPADASQEERERLANRMVAAQERAVSAGERDSLATARVTRLREDLAITLDKEAGWEAKTAALAERGYVAQQATVEAREQASVAAREILSGARGAGGVPPVIPAPIAGGAPTAEGMAPGLAGMTTAAGAVAVGVLSDAAMVGQLTNSLQSSQPLPPVVPGREPVRPGQELPPYEPVPLAERPRVFVGEEAGPPTMQLTGQRRFLGTGYAPPRVEEPVPEPARTVPPMGPEEMAYRNLVRQQGVLATAGLIPPIGPEQNPAWARMTDMTSNAAARLRAFATSPMAPFAGMIGAQLAGQVVPGQAGNIISTAGTDAFMGMMMGQMLPGGRYTTGAGAGLGLLAAGTQTPGTPGTVERFLGGGTLAAMLAGTAISMSPADIAGPPAWAIQGGLFLAAGAASAFGLGGPGKQQSDADKQHQAQQQAQIDALDLTREGAKGAAGLAQFGTDFSNALVQSFTGSTSAASAAQAKVQKVMEMLTAQMTLFGSQSERGRAAARELSQTISSAADIVDLDPGTAQQIIQGAQNTAQQVVTRQTAMMKYAAPAEIPGLLKQGLSQINALASQPEQDLKDLQAQRQKLQARLSARTATPESSIAGGIEDLLARTGLAPNLPTTQALQQALAQTNDKIAKTKAIVDYVNTIQKDAADQLAQVAIAAKEAVPIAQAQIAESRTADPIARSRIAIELDNKRIRDINDSALSDRQKTEALGPLLQQRQQDQQAAAQAQVDLMSATSGAAQAAIPSTDPIGRAAAAVKSTTDIYNYIKSNMNVFTSVQLAQALQNKNAAAQSMVDTMYQYNASLYQSQEQVAEAQARGDPFLIAAAQGGLGQRLLRIARTPQERNAAQAQIISADTASKEAARQNAQGQAQLTETLQSGDAVAQALTARQLGYTLLRTALNTQEQVAAEQMIAQGDVQLHQAYRARIQALGQLAQTLDTGDAAKQARDAQAAAHKLLATAHGTDEVIAGRQAVASADAQAHQATLSGIQARGQLAQARDEGDPVAQARDARKTAQSMLRNAHGQDEVRSAETALAQANYQYNQALEQRDISLGDLAASTTADPVQKLTDQIEGVTKALAKAKDPQTRTQLQTQLNNLKQSRDQAAAQNTEDDINYGFQMMQESAGDAIAGLEGILAKYNDLPPEMVRQINEQIRRYQLGLEQPMGSTGFDLAPGDLKLPTFYDVARGALTGAVQTNPNMQATDNSQYTNTINVYVTQAGDESAVAAAIDRTLTTNVQQRMRAAGVI